VFLYRMLCLILLVVALLLFSHFANDFGAWSHGFAWGALIASVLCAWAMKSEERERSAEELENSRRDANRSPPD
jgi:hypothetical protein